MSTVLARSVLASHLLASAQMMLPDLTQQAEALLTPIAAINVANAWALTRPLSRPLPFIGLYFTDYVFQYSHATAAQTLLLCKEPTQRSGRVVLYTHLGLGQ